MANRRGESPVQAIVVRSQTGASPNTVSVLETLEGIASTSSICSAFPHARPLEHEFAHQIRYIVSDKDFAVSPLGLSKESFASKGRCKFTRTVQPDGRSNCTCISGLCSSERWKSISGLYFPHQS